MRSMAKKYSGFLTEQNAKILVGFFTLVIISLLTYFFFKIEEYNKDSSNITVNTVSEMKNMTDDEIIDQIITGEEDLNIENQDDDSLLDDIDEIIEVEDDNYQISEN